MAARPLRFYSTRDIMDMLSVSYTRALQYMHMFEQRGQVYRDRRVIRVPATVFEQYVRNHQKERECMS